MIKVGKSLLRKVYATLITFLLSFKEKKVIYCQQKKSIKKGLKEKKTIKVAFLAIHSSVWKYDYVYRMMLSHPRFDPVLIVCPAVNYGKEEMVVELNRCCDFFSSKGYDYVKTYDEATDSYIDIRKEIDPDVLFYTNPYKGLIDDRYYIDKFLDKYTCYVPYFYGIGAQYGIFYNLLFHNLVSRIYSETETHKSYFYKYGRIKSKNVVVTGYPGTDVFIDKDYKPCDVWETNGKKRIIWAPHHSIETSGEVTFSSFLRYYEFVFELATKYKDKVQIAFKPHPILRPKLYKIWGMDKTDAYYNKWNELENGFLIEQDYVDLFLTSDAMIHDSGSFTVEYLYMNKPVLRMANGLSNNKDFNSFGLECLEMHYWAYEESEIETFVVNVIEGRDDMKLLRENFIRDRLLPPNGKLASENILDDLLKSLS